MKLIIDIGNSITKVAIFKGKEIVLFSKIKKFSLKNIQNFVANKDISSSIISSVKNKHSEIFNVADFYNGIVLSKDVPIPVKNSYKTPNTLGCDRLAVVVGAYSLYPQKEIIVFDAGTCLTMDRISEKGEYIGGRISPGINMRYKALNTFTNNLPLFKKENTTPIIGEDTRSSIISGVQRGILDEVNSIILEFKSSNNNIIFLITGGDCIFFEKELKNTIFAHPNLVLIGLNEILDFNE